MGPNFKTGTNYRELFEKQGDGKPPKVVDADRVSDLLGPGAWHSDRGYEHRFLDVDDIF